jgi:hypothetical protein
MDLNVRAFRIAQSATSEQKEPTATAAKKISGRKGGLVGGPSRARSVSVERRREIARNASNARWRKSTQENGRQD